MDNRFETNCSDFSEEDLQELSQCLNLFLNKNQILIEKYKQIRNGFNFMKTSCNIAKGVGIGLRAVGRIALGELSHMKVNSNIAKSVGTGMSTLAGVAMVTGVALTPFTFGESGVLSAGGAVATAIGTVMDLLWAGSGLAIFAGSVTTFGSDFMEVFMTKTFYSVIRQLAQQNNCSAQDLCSKLALFDHVFVKNVRNLKKINDLLEEFKAINTNKSVSKVKSNPNLDQSLDNTLPMIGIQSVCSAILVFSGGSPDLAGLAFSAVDLFFLVMYWNRSDPMIEVIDAMIQDLEQDLQFIQRANDLIEHILNNR